MSKVQSSWWPADIPCAIAINLTQIGKFDQALEIARSIEDRDRQMETFREIACGLAQAGQFSKALAILGVQKIDVFIASLAQWTLMEVIRIAGWVYPRLQKIYDTKSD